MPVVKVLSRGQVTLPRQVRRLAAIRPGDMLNIEVIGPGRLQCTVLPRLSPRELRERYPITEPVDEAADREAWQEIAAADVIGS